MTPKNRIRAIVLLGLVLIVGLPLHWSLDAKHNLDRQAQTATAADQPLQTQLSKAAKLSGDPGQAALQVKTALPASPDTVTIINELTNAAKIAGVHWTAGSATDLQIQHGLKAQPYVMAINANGPASNLQAFLRALQHDPRLITVESEVLDLSTNPPSMQAMLDFWVWGGF